MPRIRFSPRAYAASILRDARATLGRVACDRAALAAIILLLLPWWSLIFLRDNAAWLMPFSGLLAVTFSFWWMSRAGAAPCPAIKRPRLEFLFGLALLVLWVEWRIGICAKLFPGLPADFNCFKSWELEIIPKTIQHVVFPVAVLFAAGYGLRAQGLNVNLRAWWIALPALLATAADGFYAHPSNPRQFVERTAEFFFGAGLPEEVLFRAILLTRLEAWWRSPAWALFGATVFFGLAHVPINFLVFTNRDWRETWIALLTFQMGFGAVFAFAYQRTRNVWPVALLHALVDAL